MNFFELIRFDRRTLDHDGVGSEEDRLTRASSLFIAHTGSKETNAEIRTSGALSLKTPRSHQCWNDNQRYAIASIENERRRGGVVNVSFDMGFHRIIRVRVV